MISTSKFPFSKILFCSIALLGMCIYSGDSMAQSEQENSEMDNARPIDKLLIENSSSGSDVQTQHSQPSATTLTGTKSTAVKKDSHVSGEGKKNETAPSTLSFNIFLYIVDKFKAD
ncbi:hypothetical protein [Algoriphagus sp. Y33]|uniref:hypothetical protein n=1 Tax=Algoriphagus sp. Y33 TaxID=2772483 RepID=UPI001784D1CD|nr:hypothetical protein [Algoriphagus sp. Y33]